MSSNPPDDSTSDQKAEAELARVKAWLSEPDRVKRAGDAIRLAIDWVIDGGRTRRYSIQQLQPSEKVYIGNRVEHELLHQWKLEKEPPLDCMIEGSPADVKFSLETSWMIPPEAIDQICIIVTANDFNAKYSLGLFRAQLPNLGKPNRDGKRGIVQAGRSAISWIIRDGELPPNFLLRLDDARRQNILSKVSGQGRVTEMFRSLLNQPIPTTAIDTLAVQRDPSKRVRDARKALAAEGIDVLGWRYHRKKIEALGIVALEDDYWISVPR